MYRDMEKIIRKTTVDNRYSLTVFELLQLASKDNAIAIRDSFTYGYALGQRAEKKRQKKKGKKKL